MTHFWQYARLLLRYRALLVLAMVFATLSAGGLGAGLLGMKPVLDKVLGGVGAPGGAPGVAPGAGGKDLPALAADLNQSLARMGNWTPRIPDAWIAQLPTGAFTAVVWIVVGLGILTIVGAACNFLHAYLSLTIISRTIANIRRQAFRHVIHLPLRTVVSVGPSDLVSRIVYDSAALSIGFNALLSRVVAQVSKGFVAVLVAFWFQPILAGVALVAAPVVYTIIRKLGKRIRRASKSALQGQADLYHTANEVLSGLRVVKVHAAERAEAGRFHRINKAVVSQEFRVRTARALSSPLVETVALFILGGLSLVAIKAILNGHLDRAEFLIVLGSLGVAGASLKPITGLVNDMQQASAAAQRLSEITGYALETGHDARLARLPRHEREIEFRDVRLTYPNSARPAVDGVSLTIPFGSTIAFVGPNGSGKTSLLSLIPRLFDPDEPAPGSGERGCVLVDGRNIREFSVRSVRRQIAVVTQDTVLFRGSIRDNIAYGAEGLGLTSGALDERIRDAAKRARAEEFILAKPDGYDTMLGEGGSGLSGGQRQRIAIARAILREPAILILDEATSMIDAESEAQISEAISEFVGVAGAGAGEARAKGRTCLIVAHRLSTVLAADRIVVLDQGRIVDQGTHAELLGRCNLYRRLAREQLIDAPLPDAAGTVA